MNRRIIEDVKFNTNNKVNKKHIEDVIIENLYNNSDEGLNSRQIEPRSSFESSKYDFLNKKKITHSSARISQTPQLPNSRNYFNYKFFYILFLSLIIGMVYLFSTFLLSAKITIIPKNKVFELKNQVFSASKNKNNIPFELMIVSDKEYKDIVLTSSQDVKEKAKGEITLYNEFSKTVQKIAAGSFVSDEKGKTYKTNEIVMIPAFLQDKIDKTKTIPGQANVGITAFLPGEAYNGSPSSFYITAFKNTTKYDKIYGKLKTPLSGGMVGLVYLMDEKGKADLQSTNLSSLSDKLLRKLNAQVPGGYILYPNAVRYLYDFGQNITSKNPNTRVEINTTLYAYLLKESSLSDSIISKLLPDIGDKERSEIEKPNLSGLTFNFINKDQSISKEIETFDFNLTGSISMHWVPNILELKDSLAGKNKNSVALIFKNDPGISSAKVSIIPFWSSLLPSVPKNINIILKDLTKN